MKAKTTIISENCMIGGKSVIGEHSRIFKSCIGRNCKIGDNVLIENSIIWSNVEIASGCRIIYSIICDNVIIGPNCDVPRGCVLSFGVSVKPELWQSICEEKGWAQDDTAKAEVVTYMLARVKQQMNEFPELYDECMYELDE